MPRYLANLKSTYDFLGIYFCLGQAFNRLPIFRPFLEAPKLRISTCIVPASTPISPHFQ